MTLEATHYNIKSKVITCNGISCRGKKKFKSNGKKYCRKCRERMKNYADHVDLVVE